MEPETDTVQFLWRQRGCGCLHGGMNFGQSVAKRPPDVGLYAFGRRRLSVTIRAQRATAASIFRVLVERNGGDRVAA
jgi:hypothetical protein